MAWSTCKYCGEKIVWAEMPGGNWLPMDPDAGGKHECGHAAVSTVPDNSWQVGFHPAGVVCGEVEKDGLAKKAGLRSGDIIVALNSEKLSDMEHFYKVRDRISAGDKIKLRLRRGKRRLTITA